MSDFYSNLKEFCEKLKENGFSKWGTEIEDIVKYGCMSGEIFMGVRWALNRFLSEEKNIPENIKKGR